MLRSWRLRCSDFPDNPWALGAGSSLQDPVRTQAFRDLQSQGRQDSFRLALRTSDAPKDQFLAIGRLQLDVTDRDLTQLAQDDFGRHRSRLGRGLGSMGIRLVDLRLQARREAEALRPEAERLVEQLA